MSLPISPSQQHKQQGKKSLIPAPIIKPQFSMFEAKNNNQLERDVDVIESNVDRENVHQTQQHTFSLYDPFANTIEYNQKLQEFNQILKEAFRTETWGQKIRNSQSKLQNFLEDPSSSLASLVCNSILSILIILGTIVMVLESVDYIYLSSPTVWFTIDTILTGVFTLEIILRLWACATDWKSFSRYIFSVLFWVDVAAITPYYIELIFFNDNLIKNYKFGRLTGLRVIRVFSLLKMFRFINHVRYIQISFEIAGEAVRKSLGPLFPLFAAGSVMVLFLSTAIYYAERGTFDEESQKWINKKGKESQFGDIPATIWFVVTTITTVGYGDMAPVTLWGRIFSFITMICGMLLIALPSIIIGRNFSILWGNLKARNQMPPVPAWLTKITGSDSGSGGRSNYQKLDNDDDQKDNGEDNHAHSSNEKGDIRLSMREIPHAGMDSTQDLRSHPTIVSKTTELESKVKVPHDDKTTNNLIAVSCPNCQHKFKEKIRLPSPQNMRGHGNARRISRQTTQTNVQPQEHILLNTEVSDMELLRMILESVQKGNSMIKELVEANNFDDQIIFQEASIDEEQ